MHLALAAAIRAGIEVTAGAGLETVATRLRVPEQGFAQRYCRRCRDHKTGEICGWDRFVLQRAERAITARSSTASRAPAAACAGSVRRSSGRGGSSSVVSTPAATTAIATATATAPLALCLSGSEHKQDGEQHDDCRQSDAYVLHSRESLRNIFVSRTS